MFARNLTLARHGEFLTSLFNQAQGYRLNAVGLTLITFMILRKPRETSDNSSDMNA